MTDKKKVVVVGAGLAGLSASKKLIDAGFEVDLLESRRLIGGKVSAWKDGDGDWIESGLHVFFGSYRKIFDLMKEVGNYNYIDWLTPSIQYRKPGGENFRIVSDERLPCPLNLLPNFFFSHQFSIQDLLKYCRSILPILRNDRAYIDAQDEIDFQRWVKSFGMSEQMMQRMFLPMTLSLKFLPVSQISAQVVLNVFRLFITDPKGFKIGFLNGSPAEKLTRPILDYLQERGLRLSLSQKVKSLALKEDRSIKAVLTEAGQSFAGDYFIFALPCHKFRELLSPIYPDIPYFQNLRHFEGVPVMNAQFWLNQQLPTTKQLYFGTAGYTPVFADMHKVCADYRTAHGGSLIETVVAPAAELQDLSDQEILDKTWEEIKSYFPTGEAISARKSTLVRIPQSVYAPYPKLEALRPTQKTPIRNLYLAGGFTKGHEFFDSMEGAVQSGLMAAGELIGKK
ncbi:MAG: FAD-dependent oxidoreductase [Candidatus Caenarcaniphilales bacterium]|nr:FAD-dependent oxidoreductase [Candidatus Caenarcaniphilales bacterium]